MSKEKTTNVARALTAQIHATEEAIDTALGEAAHLIEAYISSRRAVRVSATVAGDVHENTLKAMMALNTAQKYMTDAHKGLTRVQKQIGLDANAIIPPYDKPPDDSDNGGITPTERTEAAPVRVA